MKNVKIVATFVCLSVAMFAQADRASITGTVSDTSGAVVPGATVTAKDVKTGSERSVMVDSRGIYILSNLAPSDYTVTAKGSGLGPTDFTGVHLNVGQERTLDLILQPATVTTEVIVGATASSSPAVSCR